MSNSFGTHGSLTVDGATYSIARLGGLGAGHRR